MTTAATWTTIAQHGAVRLVKDEDGHGLYVFTDERRYTLLYQIRFGFGTPQGIIDKAFWQAVDR